MDAPRPTALHKKGGSFPTGRARVRGPGRQGGCPLLILSAKFRIIAILAALLPVLLGASYRTSNYIVQTADPRLAEAFGKAAEQYRHDLAIEWTGVAMPNWSQPCVMTVHVGPNLGAGGATTFMFDHGEVYGWRMNIQGSAERVLDSVLPHEITHMVFASHFRAPLPRWADEGGATNVENISERAKHQKMLVRFLQTGRGIAFNQMFAMTEYPPDVMPLYAQAQSVVDYLIQQKGRRHFVTYLEDAMKTGDWEGATRRHYGIQDLGVLQTTWVAWVGRGCPPIQRQPSQPAPNEAPAQPSAVAANQRLPRPEPNLIWHVAASDRASVAPGQLIPIARPGRQSSPPGTTALASASHVSSSPNPGSTTHPSRSGAEPGNFAAVAKAGEPRDTEPIRAQTAHPQPIEQPRQIILEWTKQ